MDKKKALKFSLPFVILIVIAFTVYFVAFKQTNKQINQAKTTKVVKGKIASTLTITGQVLSGDKTKLNFEVNGTLQEVNVGVGDQVATGDELARIDDEELSNQVTIAKNNLDSANAKMEQLKAGSNSADIKAQEVSIENALNDLNRAKENLAELQNNASATAQELNSAQEQVDKAQGQYNLAVAQLEAKKAGASSYDIRIQQAAVTKAKLDYEEALKNLEKTVLASPISGTVLAVNADVGKAVGGQASTITNDFIVIADLSNLKVSASVDQVDIVKIAKDQNVNITFDAIPDKEFKGKVTKIDPNPVTEQNVTTYNIEVSLDNPDPKIKLGMAADLVIELESKENVLLVPNLAVRTVTGNKMVTKLVDGVATEIPVETGISDDENTEIASGLFEGDEIVLTVFSGTPQFSSTQRQTPPMQGIGGGILGGNKSGR